MRYHQLLSMACGLHGRFIGLHNYIDKLRDTSSAVAGNQPLAGIAWCRHAWSFRC
jgi:hypothetical protein